MRYSFKIDVTAKDCWILYMQKIYHTMVGIISLVFAVSMFAVTIGYWKQSSTSGKVVLLLACIIVPCIQPFGVYLRSVKLVKAVPDDLEMKFSEKEVFVSAGGQSESIPWSKMRYAVKERNMVILVTNGGSGYMLTNRVLGDQRDAFYEFVASCMPKK